MPEGHTIHRLARDLQRTLGGDLVRARSPQGRFTDGAALLDGRSLVRADAWGKYLFCDFGIGEVLHVHLGLIGKFRRKAVPAPDPVGMIRLRLEGDRATWDLSGPTRCELITPDEVRAITARLGADPLRRDPDVAAARGKFARSSRPVGAYLLDQSVIAGIGNVYRAELLFLCGIHPARPASSLSDDEFDELWARTVELLRIGVRMGRIVTTEPDDVGRPRSRMRAEDRLYVYHREICRRCGTELGILDLGGRPIWYCPSCQPR
jgi:endonuclease-8